MLACAGLFFDCFLHTKKGRRPNGYLAVMRQPPVVNRPASIGMTVSSPMPFIAQEMERHLHTWQTLMCISEPVVFLAAPETDGSLSDNDRPNAEDTVAVILKPGQVAVLNRGVWHSPAHGLKKESAYYWMAEAYDDERLYGEKYFMVRFRL